MLSKLVLATLILIAVFVGMVQIQRRIRGDGPTFRLKLGDGDAKQASDANELEQFIEAYRRDPTLGKPEPSALPAALAQASPAGDLGAPPRTSAPFLAGAHKLAYLLLKSALSEYHVFPRVLLPGIAHAGGAFAGESHTVDFLVCDRNLSIVCAALLDEGNRAARGSGLEEQLRARGVRCVMLASRQLPRPAQMRELILGRGTSRERAS
jgi:hypothetical protein